jgi:predicted nucleotidyltransferase
MMINIILKETVVNILTTEIDGIELITLFGSAIGPHFDQNRSDIDIAFLSSEAIENVQRWNAQEKVASILNIDIDLVNLRTCDDVLRFEVISKGENLFLNSSNEIERFLDSIYINYIQLNEDRAEIIQRYA